MKINVNKLKREAIPFIIAYVLFDLIIVGSICAGISQIPDGANLFEKISTVLSNFVDNIITFKFFEGIVSEFNIFINWSFWSLLVFLVMFIAWKIKFAPNSEYDGKESGSSEWSKHGEEFDKLSDGREILNKKEGFILSKDHYLGTDLKKVLINKNILVGGRIWCW